MKKLILPILAALVAIIYVSCSENSIEAGMSGKFSFSETENTENLNDEDLKVYCEELAKKLKDTRVDSDEYVRLKALWDEKCGRYFFFTSHVLLCIALQMRPKFHN